MIASQGKSDRCRAVSAVVVAALVSAQSAAIAFAQAAAPAPAQPEAPSDGAALDPAAKDAPAAAPAAARASPSGASGPATAPIAAGGPPSAAPAKKEGLPVKVEIHGVFDNRLMLYSSNINFTTSNSKRSIATTTATGGRGDLFQIPGPLQADGSRRRQTGWVQEGSFADLPRMDGVRDMFAEIRYRPQLEAALFDDSVRGVWQMEIGAIRFGAKGVGRQEGGAFSTDGTNVETRLAYTELTLGAHQLQLGLIPLVTNRHLWQEAAAGIQGSGSTWPGGSYHAAWGRGVEDKRSPQTFPEDPLPSGLQDTDGFFLQLDQMIGDQRVGVFGMYQRGAVERNSVVEPTEVFAEAMALAWFDEVDHDLVSVGASASFKLGPVFANLEGIVQSGKFRDLRFYAADNFVANPDTGRPQPSARASDICAATDLNCYPEIKQSGFAARLELGGDFGPLKVQYTGYYISGDTDPTDDQFENFISTDVDFFDSAVFFEGVLVNDTVHRQEPYLFDKGFLLNKLSVDYRLTESLTVGGAVVHNQLAREVTWVGVDGRLDPVTGDFRFNANGKLNPLGQTEYVEGGPPVEPFRSKDLGLEVQLKALYNINERLALGGLVAGLVAPGAAMDFYEVSIQRNGVVDQHYLTVQSNLQFTF